MDEARDEGLGERRDSVPRRHHRLAATALDDALDRLASLDPQQARIVEMRFFGGLTVEETANVLKISPRSVKRDWSTARAWLRRELSGGSGR